MSIDKNNYDIIIVGAGPVGLSYAAELSKDYKILLIDSLKIPSYRKSWAVPNKILEASGFSKYASNTIKTFGLYSYISEDNVIWNLPEYKYWSTVDEYIMLPDLLDKIKKNKAKVLSNTPVMSYKTDLNNYVEVITDKASYKAKLLIDCSGTNSIFIKQGDNIQQEFFWSVFGKRYNGSNTDGHTAYLMAHVGDIDGYKIFIDDVPEGDNKYTPWLYVVGNTRVPVEKLREYYDFAVNTEFLKPKLKGFRAEHDKYGWISQRELKVRSQDRIISLGDAGALSPWLSGTPFSFCLEHKDQFIERIKSCLEKNQLDQMSLEKIVKLNDSEELNHDIQKFAFLFLMNSNAEEWSKLVDLVDKFFKNGVLNKSDVEINSQHYFDLIRLAIEHFAPQNIYTILNRNGSANNLKFFQEVFKDILNLIM